MTVNLDESDGEAPKKTAKKSSAPTPPESAEEDEDEDEGEEEDEGVQEDEDEDEDEEMSDEEDDFEDDDQDEDELLELSDEDEDPDMLADLDAFVDQLAASDKKRKATETDNDSSAEQKKRRVLPVKSRQEVKDDAALKSSTFIKYPGLFFLHQNANCIPRPKIGYLLSHLIPPLSCFRLCSYQTHQTILYQVHPQGWCSRCPSSHRPTRATGPRGCLRPNQDRRSKMVHLDETSQRGRTLVFPAPSQGARWCQIRQRDPCRVQAPK